MIGGTEVRRDGAIGALHGLVPVCGPVPDNTLQQAYRHAWLVLCVDRLWCMLECWPVGIGCELPLVHVLIEAVHARRGSNLTNRVFIPSAHASDRFVF